MTEDDDAWWASLGARVRARREALGWSQARLANELARAMGPRGSPSQSTIQSIETGRSRRPRLLPELAAVLGDPSLAAPPGAPPPAAAPPPAEPPLARPAAALLLACRRTTDLAAEPDAWWVIDRARPLAAVPWPHHAGRDLYALRLPAAAAGLGIGDLVVVDPHAPARPGDLALRVRDRGPTDQRVRLVRLDGAQDLATAQRAGGDADLVHRVVGALMA